MLETVVKILDSFFPVARRHLFPKNVFEKTLNERDLRYAVESLEDIMTEEDWKLLSMDELFELLCQERNEHSRKLYRERLQEMLDNATSVEQCKKIYLVHGRRVFENLPLFGEKVLSIATKSIDVVWIFDLANGMEEHLELKERVIHKMLSLHKSRVDAQMIYDRASGEIKEKARMLMSIQPT